MKKKRKKFQNCRSQQPHGRVWSGPVHLRNGSHRAKAGNERNLSPEQVQSLRYSVRSGIFISSTSTFRAVDANGKRITFDNDLVNFLDWTGEMWLLRYNWATYDLKVPIVAAVCAIAGLSINSYIYENNIINFHLPYTGAAKCPCQPYKLQAAAPPPISLPLPETENPCGSNPAQI